MEYALRDTYHALPTPRVVIAVGACAISGGPFAGSPAVTNGIDHLLPVDLYIPGCPRPPADHPGRTTALSSTGFRIKVS